MTCAEDCPCPASPSFTDHPSFCGDGFCDPDQASLETCHTCRDCPPAKLYRDADGDGFGDAAAPLLACGAPAGFVTDAIDCDDTAPGFVPGAPERCGGIDEDCDGQVDEGGYRVDGFRPPLRADGSAVFRVGATVPVKVVVVDCAGERRPFGDRVHAPLSGAFRELRGQDLNLRHVRVVSFYPPFGQTGAIVAGSSSPRGWWIREVDASRQEVTRIGR